MVNIFVFGGSVSARRITHEYSIHDVTTTWTEVNLVSPVHNTVGSTIETNIFLHFKLCERRNSECTCVFKVLVFAKIMPGLQLSLYTRERLRALMSEDSTVKHAMTELGKEGCGHAGKLFGPINMQSRSGQPTKLTERVQEP